MKPLGEPHQNPSSPFGSLSSLAAGLVVAVHNHASFLGWGLGFRVWFFGNLQELSTPNQLTTSALLGTVRVVNGFFHAPRAEEAKSSERKE